MVIAALIVDFVALVLNMTRTGSAPRWLIGLVATVFALPMFTVLIAVLLGRSIVVAFAQRAIAVEDIGPVAALGSGWRLLRLHVGESLLTWLVNFGLAMATAIAGLAGMLGLLVVLAGVCGAARGGRAQCSDDRLRFAGRGSCWWSWC